ncbi:MAG: transcriptional repressor LexA [Candidatus Sericytochromatia bacterium]
MEQQLSKRELDALRIIRNHILQMGRSPSVRQVMHEMDYRSPRSASILIDNLIDKNFIKRRSDGGLQLLAGTESDSTHAQTVNVPLVGLVTCGEPIMAEENVEAMIPVSTRLARPPHRYFLLRVKGDSMNEREIFDQDLVLIRQQTRAEEGDMVVALIDTEATVKEFHRSRNMIVLKPRSSNPVHQPILLTDDFQIQGVVVATLPQNILN